MKDLIIIGGGPAGLSAGIYAGRAKLDILMLEKGMPGGLVVGTELIENYPGFPEGVGGFELAYKLMTQAQKFGLAIETAGVEKIEFTEGQFIIHAGEQKTYRCRAVILATGAKPQLLQAPGEERLTGKGVSYCATCDGAFFREKTVAVVGGGDAAVEEAIFLTKFARKVLIIHRRQELRSTKVVQQKAMTNPQIEFVLNSVIEEIVGKNAVEGVRIRDVNTGENRPLAVDGVFIYIGQKPDSEIIKGLAELDGQGYVLTDDNMRTTCPGLFAAGDVRKKLLRQAVTAVADGAIAAVAAERYLEKAPSSL